LTSIAACFLFIGSILNVLTELLHCIGGPFLPVFARTGARHGPMAIQGRLRAVQRFQSAGDPSGRISSAIALSIVDRGKYVHGLVIHEFQPATD